MRNPTPEQTDRLDRSVRQITDLLGLDELVVAQLLGFDDDGIADYLAGDLGIDGGNAVMIERALALFEVYTLLGSIVGEDEQARRWLYGENLALAARPVELLSTPEGLMRVLGYLQATVHGS